MKIYRYLFFALLSGLVIIPREGNAQKLQRTDYIDQYKDLAMREMLRSGVPASITLAQGMLESDNGNSRLARKGNNHFGIKCHSDWEGKRIYHDDDAPNECFRKYKSVYDSYVDHSDFLRDKNRYASLFELDITDYKAWARGLKKAGYATSRTYAEHLIRIIEENDLDQYDFLALNEGDGDIYFKKSHAISVRRKVLKNNRIDYIHVKAGDTFSSLNEEFDLLNREIFNYNELNQDSVLRPGQIIYLQPKRKRAEKGKDFHILKDGESLYEVSQLYGVKLEKIYEKNLLEPGDIVEPGTRINLRRKKKGWKFNLEDAIEEEQEPEDEFMFEFDG